MSPYALQEGDSDGYLSTYVKGVMIVLNNERKKLIDLIPHPLALLFYIIVFAAFLTYIVPAGSYDRETIDGETRAIPGTFEYEDQNPVNIFDLFTAIPEGFQAVSEIVFIVFAAAMMFGMLERTGMIENTIGSFVKRLGLERKYLIVVIMTFMYGFIGMFVGLENAIPLIPIAVVLSLAIGGDSMLGAGIGIGGVMLGFGLAPFNPYTVGVGHTIAELQLFSGWPLRSVLVITALSLLTAHNVRYFKKILNNPEKSLSGGIETTQMQLTRPLQEYNMRKKDIAMLIVFIAGLVTMLIGVFTMDWFITEISAIFLMVAVASGIIARMNGSEIAKTFSKALEPSVLAAILIGTAQAIRLVMENGNITDTVSFALTSVMESLPTVIAAIFMSISQTVINVFIPSGSAQALATLPIMIPVGDMIGLTRQTTVLAFQIGDGVVNTVNPTLGGLLAMLGLCKVPYGSWLRFILPITVVIFIISSIFLTFAVLINWT